MEVGFRDQPHRFVRLPRLLRQNVVKVLLRPDQFLSLVLDVRRLSSGSSGRLVQHDASPGEGAPSALKRGKQTCDFEAQHSSCSREQKARKAMRARGSQP